MKKKILYLFIFSLMLVGVNNYNIKVNAAGENEEEWTDVDLSAGSGATGKCINNGLCGNQNFIMFETTVSHMDNNGIESYATYYFTNNPSKANGKNVIYVEGMTTTSYDIGTAGQQLQDYLSANDYAVTKQLLANSGITEFVGSQNGKDAYGLISQPYMQYKDSNGNLQMATLKDILSNGLVSNRNRVVEYLTKVATGVYGVDNNTLLEYINGFTIEQCQSLSPLALSGQLNGCGQLIIDISQLLKRINRNPVPSCPGGTMNINNPTPSCYETLGGITYTYSYTASGGSQANVHRQYGIDQNAPGTGAYCKLYCQEEGTATLPGALGTSVQLGSYSIWPTSSSNETDKFKSDYYPLKFSGRKECKLVLMPDNGNFPGNGCLQDPVAEYMCIYSGTQKSGTTYSCGRSYNNSVVNVGNNTRDYAGKTFEQVRVANGNYFNEPDYCGEEKTANGSATCSGPMCTTWTKYKVSATSQYYNSNSYGVANYTHYKDLVDKINKAADNAKSKCENVTQSTIDTANSGRQCTSCSGNWSNGPSAQGTCLGYEYEDDCQDVKDAKAAIGNCNSAKQSYNDAVKEATDYEKNMQTCRSYITDFNYARNILNEIGLCGNFSASGDDYYRFNSTASISYISGKYGVSGSLNKDVDSSISCEGQCSGLGFKEKSDYRLLSELDTVAILSNKVAQIENRNINFVASETIYSSNSKYSYVDKKKNEYSETPLNSNYLSINTLKGGLAKVLPTDYNLDVVDSKGDAIKYTMNLTNTSFGEDNKFNVTANGDYVCKYDLSKKNDSCICPQDSKMAGKDLMYYVINDPISCSDAQTKYCDNSSITECSDDDCPEYCPDMSDPTPLTPCLKTGLGYDACVALVCPNSNNNGSEYRCKNTNGLRTGMDITDCVQTKLAQGLTLDQALNYCDSVVCPVGKTIIYRTIKLENPFPSMDADATVTQTNLKVGMFNNNVKGRYPGTNWNGTLTVNKKIRNNRGVSGTTIYQKKEPLYTFVLNGTTIKKIRDYNDKQKEGYNDFTLDCKKDKHAACVSYVFVHNAGLSGLTGGTCQNISINNGFYTCTN